MRAIFTQNITARYYYAEQSAGSTCISMDSISSLSSLVICRRTRERHAENTPHATDNASSPREFKISGPHTCVYAPRAFHSSSPFSSLLSFSIVDNSVRAHYTHTHTRARAYTHTRSFDIPRLRANFHTCVYSRAIYGLRGRGLGTSMTPWH